MNLLWIFQLPIKWHAILNVKVSTQSGHCSQIPIHGLLPTCQWSTKYMFIYCLLNYCFYQAMQKFDILIMIYFEIIQILMKYYVTACIFIKTIQSEIHVCVRYMVNSPWISVIMFSIILFWAPSRKFSLGKVKSRSKKPQDTGA